jgi:hypothetical protein
MSAHKLRSGTATPFGRIVMIGWQDDAPIYAVGTLDAWRWMAAADVEARVWVGEANGMRRAR